MTLNISAQKGSCGAGVIWTLENETLTISGNGKMSDFSSSGNTPSWYIYKDNIKKVIIESGVTHIGNYAFYQYANLEEVLLSEGLLSIGGYSFNGCSKLVSIDFPVSLKIIGGFYDQENKTATMNTMPFADCTSLESVEIPSGVCGVASRAFLGCNNLQTLYWGVANYMENTWLTYNSSYRATNGYNPFYGCPIKEVTFGEKVDSIPDNLMYGCAQLASVKTMGSVEYVGSGAFEGTYWLDSYPVGPVYVDKVLYTYHGKMVVPTEVSVKEGTKTITDWAFRNQTYLTKITIPSTLTYMGENTFNGCTSLGELKWNAVKCADFESHPFPESLSFVELGNQVSYIPSYTFQGCKGIFELKLPNSLLEIGNHAFSGCEGLVSIELPSNVNRIGDYAFEGCSNLGSITIPEKVTYLGGYAFFNCTSLLEVGFKAVSCKDGSRLLGASFNQCPVERFIIGDKVERLPKYICQNLKITELVIPNSVETIGESCFSGCKNLKSLIIGESVDTISNNVFSGCSALIDVQWNARNARKVISSSNSPLFSSALTNIVFGDIVDSIPDYLCYSCENLKTVTFSPSIKKIGDYAFSGCKQLVDLNLPDALIKIGRSTFNGCSSLQDVVIPNNVTTIGSSAFSSCDGLKSFTVGENVSSINTGMFNGCNNLSQVNWLAIHCSNDGGASLLPSSVTDVIIGDKVQYIPSYFCQYNSNIKQILFPEELTTIGAYAFYGCTSLTELNIPDSCSVIEGYAFANTGLNSLFIPATLKTIGSSAFANNEKLSEVIMAKEVFDLPNKLFYRCDNLNAIYVPDIEGYLTDNGWNDSGYNLLPMIRFNCESYIYNKKEPDLSYDVLLPEEYQVENFKYGILGVNAGVYDIDTEFSFTGSRNFTVNIPFHYTVTPKELTVSTGDYIRKYGENNPDFLLAYDGFVEGEDVSVLHEQPLISCEATEASNVGVYGIYISGGIADNYIFNYVNGTLTVEQADQVIKWEQDFSDLHVGDTVILNASVNSGLNVYYEIEPTDLVDLKWTDDNKMILECLSEGIVKVKAYQYGDMNWNEAESVVKELVISKGISVDELKNYDCNIYAEGGNIIVENIENNMSVQIRNVQGLLLYSNKNNDGHVVFPVLRNNVYIVQIGQYTKKLFVK